jgi:hypothetical protein
MSNHLLGYLVCAAIITFGLVYHLDDWALGKRRKRASDPPR